VFHTPFIFTRGKAALPGGPNLRRALPHSLARSPNSAILLPPSEDESAAGPRPWSIPICETDLAP